MLLRRQNATHRDAAPVAHFKGFANVKKRNELALMWAVWKHGPVAISIDASLPTFRFYSEGVYKDKHCHTGKVRTAVCVAHEAFQVSVIKFKVYVGGARIPVEMDYVCVLGGGLEGWMPGPLDQGHGGHAVSDEST